MPNFFVSDWKSQLKEMEAADWKESIYFFLRPTLDFFARKQLQLETIVRLQPHYVLPGKGFPWRARRKWANNYQSLAGKTILVQGTGNGWDAASWARHHPKKIIAVDLFPFDSWPHVRKEVYESQGVEIEFYTGALHDLPFIADQSVDLCASDMVFEHVSNLPDVMRETYRILKPDGYVYAMYGPLWYCAGGDHFARGGLRNAFNHILLNQHDYQEYFNKFQADKEDFQSGGRYMELNLFSRLRTEEYLAIFHESGFKIDDLIIEISDRSMEFRNSYSSLFEQLQKHNPTCVIDDFLICSNIVRLQKYDVSS